MSQNVGLEQQQQIRGADGTLLWTGSYEMGIPYVCINTAAAAMLMSEGVRYDGGTALSCIPRQETTAAGGTASSDMPQSKVNNIIRISAAANTMFLGVTTEPCAIGGQVLVAGIGSLITVITTATALAGGASIGGSATPGQAAANATATQILGTVFKINDTVANFGTGSTGFAGILVNPR